MDDVRFIKIDAETVADLEKALGDVSGDLDSEYIPYGFSLGGVLLVSRVRVSTSFQKFKQRLVTYSILSNSDYYKAD